MNPTRNTAAVAVPRRFRGAGERGGTFAVFLGRFFEESSFLFVAIFLRVS
jgi:hypothetical protein